MEAEAFVAPIEEAEAEVVMAEEVPPLHTYPAGHSGYLPHGGAVGADGTSYSFKEFASGLGLSRFSTALEAADLLGYVDTCEPPLTIFAPSDEAFGRLGALPEDLQARPLRPPPAFPPPFTPPFTPASPPHPPRHTPSHTPPHLPCTPLLAACSSP